MSDPDNRGRALIDAYRRVTVPDSEAEEMILQRLLDEQPLRSPTGRIRRLAIASGLTVLLAAMVLLALRSIVSSATRDNDGAPQQAPYQAPPKEEQSTVPPPDPQRPATRRAPEAGTAPEPEPAPEPALQPIPVAAESPPLSGRRVATPRTAPPPSAASHRAATVKDEARLLAQAQAALRDDEPSRALEALAQHLAQFPEGMMKLERDALRAVALCQNKQLEAGRALAKKLVLQRPRSRYTNRIRRACELDGLQ